MPNDNLTGTEAEAVAALATAHQTVRDVNGIPALVLPPGYRVELLDKTLAAPIRKKGTTTLNDVASFISVARDQQTADTRYFSTLNPPTFTAVFNATADGAGWGDHRAHYAPPLSEEWKAWAELDGKAQNQVKLAQFLENNLEDITRPDGATLLGICRTLQAKKSVEFVSVVNPNNGSNQFTYNEDVKGSAVAGTVDIPETFEIAIPVFENGPRWAIQARLRFTLDAGKLAIWYELVRPMKTLEAAVAQIRGAIATETGKDVLNGAAPDNR